MAGAASAAAAAIRKVFIVGSPWNIKGSVGLPVEIRQFRQHVIKY
jgi:hypothetical protein